MLLGELLTRRDDADGDGEDLPEGGGEGAEEELGPAEARAGCVRAGDLVMPKLSDEKRTQSSWPPEGTSSGTSCARACRSKSRRCVMSACLCVSRAFSELENAPQTRTTASRTS